MLLKAKWTYSSEKFVKGYWSPVQSAQKEMIETMINSDLKQTKEEFIKNK